jgi:[methyl-Co(III) methanol-specific corrinoid protein]:coenzyme M methyltransferase
LIFLRAVRKRKDEVHHLMEFVTENLIIYAGALVRAGADVVVIGDPTATGEILGPAIFKEFGLPYLNQITEELETRHKIKSIVHICGDIKSIVEELNNLHAVGLSVDAVTNLRRLRKEVKGKILMGNVSTYLLANGSAERVTQVGLNCLRNGADILSPACGVSPRTPLENIKALAKVVREYHQDGI